MLYVASSQISNSSQIFLHFSVAKKAAGRRELAMRLSEAMKRERRAQWMASLAGPGGRGEATATRRHKDCSY